MSKNRNRKLISLAVLIVLAVLAYLLARKEGYFSGGYSTLNKGLSDFAIRDTAAINKFVISMHDGTSATLTRKTAGEWTVNEKYRARKDAIENILAMAFKIKVKSTVNEKARENVIRRIAGYFKKIVFYINDRPAKIFYVGPPAADNEGSFMVLEIPGQGKSEEPFVMEIPGFTGVLDARVFTNEEEWKFTGIFNYDPHSIRQVTIGSGEKPAESFVLRTLQNNDLELLDGNLKSVGRFDTVSARGYLMHYQKIHYENKAKLLTRAAIDSMLLAVPYYTVEVELKSGDKKKIRIYRMPSRSGEVDMDGQPLRWNPDRAYALLPDGEAVVVQYNTFDKILRSLQTFRLQPGRKAGGPPVP